uniref:Uncharacterized protein n=1 Tax=Nelumbo nucifera TaxID=4432 RepID=A0A822ZKY9_NELNU|nr:TPA_asm: hypothetical protein HUJ06_001887 [Nelumbo nucifera]
MIYIYVLTSCDFSFCLGARPKIIGRIAITKLQGRGGFNNRRFQHNLDALMITHEKRMGK